MITNENIHNELDKKELRNSLRNRILNSYLGNPKPDINGESFIYVVNDIENNGWELFEIEYKRNRLFFIGTKEEFNKFKCEKNKRLISFDVYK